MVDQFSLGTRIDRGDPFALKASGTVETASTTGAAVDTGTEGGSLTVTVSVVAGATGTTPTLNVVIEGSQDGANWFTLGTVGANGYAVGTTATAPSNFTTSAVTVNACFPRPQLVRARSVIGGTTPSFTYAVSVVAN